MKKKWKGIILVSLMAYMFIMALFLNRPSFDEKMIEKQTLTIWGWDETIPEAFSEYQLSHPQTSLNYVHVEKKEYLDKLKLSLALQQPLPDICILENEMLDNFIQTDLFEDLTQEPYNLKEDELLENRLAEVKTKEGGIWGVPAIPGSSGIAYNRKLAKQFLNTEDPNQVAVVFNSWADVISKGQSLMHQQKNFAMFSSLEDPAVILYGQSIKPYIKDQKMSNPYQFLNYFRILEELRDTHLVKNYQQYSPKWLNSFQEGEVFFYPCPLWMIHLGVFAGEESFGFTVPPSGSYQWGGTIWAIPKSSLNKDLAWDFMHSILLTPAGAMYNKNKENGTFISYKQAYAMEGYKDLYLDNFENQNIGKLYFNQILPSMDHYEQGENSSVVRSIYLEVVKAMSQMEDLDAFEAFDLFLSRIQEQLPQVEVVLE